MGERRLHHVSDCAFTRLPEYKGDRQNNSIRKESVTTIGGTENDLMRLSLLDVSEYPKKHYSSPINSPVRSVLPIRRNTYALTVDIPQTVLESFDILHSRADATPELQLSNPSAPDPPLLKPKPDTIRGELSQVDIKKEPPLSKLYVIRIPETDATSVEILAEAELPIIMPDLLHIGAKGQILVGNSTISKLLQFQWSNGELTQVDTLHLPPSTRAYGIVGSDSSDQFAVLLAKPQRKELLGGEGTKTDISIGILMEKQTKSIDRVEEDEKSTPFEMKMPGGMVLGGGMGSQRPLVMEVESSVSHVAKTSILSADGDKGEEKREEISLQSLHALLTGFVSKTDMTLKRIEERQGRMEGRLDRLEKMLGGLIPTTGDGDISAVQTPSVAENRALLKTYDGVATSVAVADEDWEDVRQPDGDWEEVMAKESTGAENLVIDSDQNDQIKWPSGVAEMAWAVKEPDLSEELQSQGYDPQAGPCCSSWDLDDGDKVFVQSVSLGLEAVNQSREVKIPDGCNIVEVTESIDGKTSFESRDKTLETKMKMREVLTDLCSANFHSATEQMLQIRISDRSTLEGVVAVIIERGFEEPQLIARLCKALDVDLPAREEWMNGTSEIPTGRNLFREELMKQCWCLFRKVLKGNTAIWELELSEQFRAANEETEQTEPAFDGDTDTTWRMETVVKVQLIGELFNVELIRPTFVLGRICDLLRHEEDSGNADVECAYDKTTVIGWETFASGQGWGDRPPSSATEWVDTISPNIKDDTS
ncbi:hypothetical protein HDV00_006785 [Rhizophlyctis rosea]|nr:hypothetical protein HDV00_006785 [Rhizophlyctis rosea]